jgi:putative salt-induced outer membrane protein YdiY
MTMPAITNLAKTAVFALVLSTLVASAHAQDAVAPPPHAAQHTELVGAPPPVENQTMVQLAAGATLNGGNTQNYSANAGGRLQLIRVPHQLTVEVLGVLGYSKNLTTGDLERTSGNVVGRARYDWYMSRMNALFAAIQPRRDTFAGLNARVQNQVGYLRNLYFPQDEHRLWSELGYDLSYDVFAAVAPMPGAPKVKPSPDTDLVHSARLFFGYTNIMHPLATVNLGAETLFDVEDKKNVRVNGVAELTSTLNGAFKLGVQYRMLFDNVPVEGVKKKYDTITAIQLIYTYDSLANKPKPPPCPVCDCTAEVNAARESCAPPPQAEPPVTVQPAPEVVPPVAPATEAPPPPAVPAPPAAPAPAP